MSIRVIINDVDNFDLFDLMNQYVKLKIKYWTIDFFTLQLDLDMLYIQNDKILHILSNDIYGGELVMNELKNIIKFFNNYKIEINGSIERKIDTSSCEFIIVVYEVYDETIIYKMKKFCHNNKVDELNYMKKLN
jgi:hypothetical protein